MMASTLREPIFFISFRQSPWINVTASILAFSFNRGTGYGLQGLGSRAVLAILPHGPIQLANFAS